MDVSCQQSGRQKPPALVVLTGFRATGKSAVGKVLAGRLGYRFVDTDAVVTGRLGCSIADSVQRHGWQPFRDCEQKVLQELVGVTAAVVATGGGAVLHRGAWQALQNRAFVVWLQAGSAAIVSRLAGDEKTAGQRPSLSGHDAVTEIPLLLQEREPLYRAGSDLSINTEDAVPDELAASLYAHLMLRPGTSGQ